MKMRLDGEEASAASSALLDWLESQEIDPPDAVRVLTIALVAIIHEIALRNGSNAKDGGKIVADIIVESLP